MSNQLPPKIQTQAGNNEGFEYRRDDTDLLDELIDNYNQLIEYLEAKS